MEMLTKNIVMAGCGCNSDVSVEVQPSVSEALNGEMINAIGLARAYVPTQPFTETMCEMNSLACGTVFGELVMPYVKGSALARFEGEECGNE